MNKKGLRSESYFYTFLFYFWFSFFLLIGSTFVLVYALSRGYIGDLPDSNEIDNLGNELININNRKNESKIYDCNKIFIGNLFNNKRNLISYKDLPKNLINALLAKEDVRFRKHSGIDAKSMFRAILSFGKKGGGSTISQQLAKLLFTKVKAINKMQRIYQKILEWIIAVELEKRYTKEEIITMYYNKFDFLYNAIGIKNASIVYFNKKVSNLNLGECATLVGMLENPSFYNPVDYPNKSIKQKNLVLKQMEKYNFINKKKYKEELKKNVKINFGMQRINSKLSTYYTMFLKKEIKNALNNYKEITGKKINLYNSGLKIYISIDSRMQKYAEKSMKKHLKSLQNLFDILQKKNKNAPFSNLTKKETEKILHSAMKRTFLYQYLKQKNISEKEIIKIFKKPKITKIFTWNGPKKKFISPWDLIRYQKGIIQAGLLSIESNTGYIKSWIGGIDFNHFQYDHVEKTRRQVGSIFKPILYASAIEKLHYGPCTKISNDKFQLGNWIPKNSNRKYGGFLTLKDGLAFSVNTISARLISKVKPKPVIDLAKKMGIYSFIPEKPSIALGSADITLYEMTSAFNTFTNYGRYVKPNILVKIEDKNGNIIKENINPISRRVLSKEISSIMLELMKGVVRYGTAKRLYYKYLVKGDIAGKTGTTNNHADGWFIGMIPNLTTGIWVGWEDRFSHFNDLKLGQGANMALPIWAYYIKSLYNDKNLSYNKKSLFNNSLSSELDISCIDNNNKKEKNYKKIEKENLEKEILEDVEGEEEEEEENNKNYKLKKEEEKEKEIDDEKDKVEEKDSDDINKEKINEEIEVKEKKEKSFKE